MTVAQSALAAGASASLRALEEQVSNRLIRRNLSTTGDARYFGWKITDTRLNGYDNETGIE